MHSATRKGERCFLSPHWNQLCPTPIPGVTEIGGTGRKPLLTQTAHPASWAHVKAVCFSLSAAAAGGKLSLPASPLPSPLQAAGPVQQHLLLLAELQELNRKACLGGPVSPPGGVGKCTTNLAV